MSTPEDLEFVRLAIKEADQAREHGNHPFAALLVNASGEVLMAAENSVITDNDPIAHAEINLLHAATKKLSAEQISLCSVYTNAEPCPMCASAMVWNNIRRVVFGLGMNGIYEVFGGTSDAPSLKMESRQIFRSAPWPIEVQGPLLEEEAKLSLAGFWESL